MQIAVVGTGYVGLVTGTCLSETGNTVTCIDIDEQRIQDLNAGKIPIYEPGLETLFERNTRQGRLLFTTSLKEGVQDAQFIFLALPTPPGEDGAADLSYILSVAKDLRNCIDQYVVIVDKSTVPIGTAEKVEKIIAEKVSRSHFDVVSNPEFLREGFAVDDFMKPDRVIIGTNSDKANELMHLLYEPFVRQGNPIIDMDLRSAEMTKYAANAYLATRISYMNEIANVCERFGADVDLVRKGMGSDTRIGKRFLFPGVGFGGSCFPKDVKALRKMSDEAGYTFKILGSVMQVNSAQKQVLVQKIARYFNDNLEGKTVAVWGLSFKPNTDDVREAPALSIIHSLREKGVKIQAFDPEATDNARRILGDEIIYTDTMYEALKGADALAIVTEWNLFRSPNFAKMKLLMRKPAIFDGRNLYSIAMMEGRGFHYESIGRNTAN